MTRPNNLLVYSFRPLTVDQTIGYFDYFFDPEDIPLVGAAGACQWAGRQRPPCA